MASPDLVAFEPPEALDSLVALLSQCAARRIRVCHWKSNSHLAAALHGTTDLDLLVHPDDRTDFLALLAEVDIKAMKAAPGKEYPYVENHLGLDPGSGRLFHLHVHYALVLGQQHVKDYVLPLVESFLSWTRELEGVPVPAAALEMAILRTRAALKYRLRDGVKDALGVRTPGVPNHIQEELRWLEADSTADDVERARRAVAPILPWEVLDQIPAAAAQRQGLKLLQLRTQLRGGLRRYRRVGRVTASLRYGRAVVRKRVPRRGRSRRRMTLPGSGMAVAIIGADGSGKSSVVGALEHSLGWRLTVRPAYMGTAQPSGRTAVYKWLSKKAGAVARRIEQSPSLRDRADLTNRVATGLLAARRLSEARDRRQRSRDAQREVAAGGIVIFDRFPLPGVTIDGRTMDGPRIRAESRTTGPVVDRMARLEESLLAQVVLPDLVVALHVDPVVSLERSPDHDPAAITAKAAAIATMDDPGVHVVDVDANQGFDSVVRSVLQTVWDQL